jgi:hypothetical protein
MPAVPAVSRRVPGVQCKQEAGSIESFRRKIIEKKASSMMLLNLDTPLEAVQR